MHVSVVPLHRPEVSKLPEDIYPFMNEMDEIAYWISTKRAPCLMNYDNLMKKQTEVAHCSKTIDVHSLTQEVPLPKKKKKRKLSLCEVNSVSTEKPHDVFETSQNKPVLSIKSDSESDLDFNIKKSSVKQKAKHPKLLKRSLQKKNKVATSTPKPISTTLRRSLRQAKLNNSHLNSSCLVFQSEIKNGSYQNSNTEKLVNNSNKNSHPGGDQIPNCKKVVNEKLKTIINGQCEDLSDVSGFTANYIRSTKAQSNKVPRKLNYKGAKNLVKESKNSQKDGSMIICANKGVNTGLIKAPMLNCSTDSDQHIINLVSKQNHDKTVKVNRGTSILKFMDSKNKNTDSVTRKSNTKFSISFQSSTSRYPKRHKVATHTSNLNNNTTNISSEFSSDRKENPEEKMSRTRSGRNIGLTIRQPTNSVLVFSNSTEQVSSMVSMNVATPEKDKKKKPITRQIRTRFSEKRDSVKERSGFSACFSDSDDSEPLQRKFFCD